MTTTPPPISGAGNAACNADKILSPVCNAIDLLALEAIPICLALNSPVVFVGVLSLLLAEPELAVPILGILGPFTRAKTLCLDLPLFVARLSAAGRLCRILDQNLKLSKLPTRVGEHSLILLRKDCASSPINPRNAISHISCGVYVYRWKVNLIVTLIFRRHNGGGPPSSCSSMWAFGVSNDIHSSRWCKANETFSADSIPDSVCNITSKSINDGCSALLANDGQVMRNAGVNSTDIIVLRDACQTLGGLSEVISQGLRGMCDFGKPRISEHKWSHCWINCNLLLLIGAFFASKSSSKQFFMLPLCSFLVSFHSNHIDCGCPSIVAGALTNSSTCQIESCPPGSLVSSDGFSCTKNWTVGGHPEIPRLPGLSPRTISISSFIWTMYCLCIVQTL